VLSRHRDGVRCTPYVTEGSKKGMRLAKLVNRGTSMKIRIAVLAMCALAAVVTLLAVRQSWRAKKHEDYLLFFGRQITLFSGDNNDVYPKTLREQLLWEASVGHPNQEEWLLKQCVCPITNHKPRTLDDVDRWADIKVVPYLAPMEAPMLAYCPAENHKDNKVYVVIHDVASRNAADDRRRYFYVKSMSQEEFDAKLEEQRIVCLKRAASKP
jgi:hypothetical protein